MRACRKDTIQGRHFVYVELNNNRVVLCYRFKTNPHQISAEVDKIIGHSLVIGKGILTVELSSGQMVEDVKLAVNGRIPVYHYGTPGGKIFSPDDVLKVIEEKLMGGY